MTLQPIPSEFPYIWRKCSFLFISVGCASGRTAPWRCPFTVLARIPSPLYRHGLVLPLPVSKDIAVDERGPVLSHSHSHCLLLSLASVTTYLVLVLVLYPSCPVLSSLHSLYICVSFPISVSVLVLYPSCPVQSSFPNLIFLFLLLFLSVSLFFTLLVLSCRLFALSLYLYLFSYLCYCPCCLPFLPCPVVFALSLFLCFFTISVNVLVLYPSFPVLLKIVFLLCTISVIVLCL